MGLVQTRLGVIRLSAARNHVLITTLILANAITHITHLHIGCAEERVTCG